MIRLLEGVRVLECAVLFNGDQTGRLLGDMGADVIKVEAPGVGDYLRDFLGQIAPHQSPAHLYVNRNKRSITLNLRTEEGRRLFFDLLRTTDIFVDGFAGDACAALGIGYEDQRKVKSDIIYAQCSGFGLGPYQQIPTHGMMMGALGGGVQLRLGADGLVEDLGGMGDGTVVGATNTALAAVAALRYRDRTGEGAYIDGAGSDSVLATNWFYATYAWNEHRIVDRQGMTRPTPSRAHAARNAKYHYYETKDRKFVLFCGIEHKFWDNFCDAIGRGNRRAAKDTTTPVDFARGDVDLVAELQSVFHTRTLAEWVDFALEHDVALGPANQLEDLLDDPHLRAREIIYEEVHPHAGPITQVGWPAPIRDQPFEERTPAPLLGEHTDEVLAELGLTADEVAELRRQRVV
jgi:crotonobetainyl-CoA:carnitine CoA-transferase CaiB-like acyl-CoA transferase